jgi:hypothetical protein
MSDSPTPKMTNFKYDFISHLSAHSVANVGGRHDTQHKDIQYNDNQDNVTQRNNKNMTLSTMPIDTKCCFAECRLC